MENDTEGCKIKTSILLTCIDQRRKERYETFTFEPCQGPQHPEKAWKTLCQFIWQSLEMSGKVLI